MREEIKEKYIYKITNLINNKIYIGQTNDLKRRIQEHRTKNKNTPIHKAIVKYGWENFKLDVLYFGSDYNNEEKKWIKFYDSQNNDKGYNIVEGGQDSLGEDNPASVNTKEQVDLVKKLLITTKLTHNEISEKTGVSPGCVASINNGASWFDKNEKYPLRYSRVPNEKVEEIIELLRSTNLSSIKISDITGISSSIIRLINIGKECKRENIVYPIRQTEKNKSEEVIKLLLETSLTYKEIAEQVGVSTETIGKINNGKSRRKDYLDYPIRKETKVHGVRQTPSGKWSARIKIKNTEFYLGIYNSKEDAEKARLNAENKFKAGEKIE